MKETTNKDIVEIVRKLMSIDHIAPSEIPNIPLYIDQVTTFMDEHLADSKRSEDDKILTKTMINNYTKMDLLPPSDKKKYSKNHMFMLIFIYYLKNMMTISDIQTILAPLNKYFFDGKQELSLEDIYERIFNNEKEHTEYVIHDIMKQFKDSKKVFPEITDDVQSDYLSQFAFICMLSYDVYMKMSLIERMVDHTLGKFSEDK